MSVRLASIAPDLVSRLDSRSDTELANIVAVVAREAAARSGLDEPVVASALDRIRTGEPSLSDRSEVEELAARLDEHAWDIQESDDGARHDSQRYLLAFQRARAASALAFALDRDREAALESIYEAQAALGSIDAVRRLIEPLLTSG